MNKKTNIDDIKKQVSPINSDRFRKNRSKSAWGKRVRHTLVLFFKVMENKILANVDKSDWRELSQAELMELLKDEVKELDDSLKKNVNIKSIDSQLNVIDELSDCANILYFIMDKFYMEKKYE